METVTLANGVEMPLLGFGTWALRGGDCTRVVEEALDAGYRLIDTAQMYDNETEVGRALVASNVPREEIFLTTKIYRPSNSYAKATRAIDASLAALGTDYVDLLLLQIEGGRRMDHGLGKRRSVNALSHIGCSFLSMGAGRFSR